MKRPKALVSWSSGKDSAYALEEVRRRGELDVVGLLTTVSTPFERVSMHGGPMFRRAIAVRAGEVVERDGFIFAEWLLAP